MVSRSFGWVDRRTLHRQMPLAHFSRIGGYGNRTPDLLHGKPEDVPLHHQPYYLFSTMNIKSLDCCFAQPHALWVFNDGSFDRGHIFSLHVIVLIDVSYCQSFKSLWQSKSRGGNFVKTKKLMSCKNSRRVFQKSWYFSQKQKNWFS